jgi:hypothetical protein
LDKEECKMKRTSIRLGLVFVLLFTTVIGLPNIGRATSQSLATEATWTPIVTLPVGSDDGQIAYQLGVEGAIARGPQAFAVGPDHSIYVLDSVQRRVHVIAGGVVQKTISIPSAIYPREILATADSLYILDDDNRVLQVSYTGELTLEYKLPPGLASHQVYRLLSRPNGKVLLWTAYYRMFDLDRLPASIDLEAGVWQKERRGRGIQSPGGDLWIGEAADLTAGQLVTDDGRKTIDIPARLLWVHAPDWLRTQPLPDLRSARGSV